GAVYSIMALCVLYFFSNSIISLFMDRGESASVSQNVIQNARFFLLCNGVTYFLLALVNIVRFMIQGMGFSKTAVFAGIFELIGRSTIGVWIVPLLGFKGACLASPLAWVLADAFLIPAFFYCQKKL
ncbi:MAG TPA: MATE family efflux transporter, partial [Treponema sp.]|nr:MATE family efflux transporter [Treponema sp.]